MHITEGKTDCLPEETGYHSGRILALDEHFARMMERGEIEGAAYCISKNGKVIAEKGMGLAHYYDHNDSMRPDTIHGIASITKTFTAAALMKLVEDGYTRLDVKVGDILPQFAREPFDGINLFHLLPHTSGLQPDAGCFPNPYFAPVWRYMEEAAKEWKPGEEFDWLTPSMSCGMRRKPGEEWQYCSYGFVVLGAVIEKISGVMAEKYIHDNILSPLGMKDTFFLPADSERLKRIHVTDEEDKEYIKSAVKGEKQCLSSWKDYIPNTGGGLFATPGDLIRFANMMLGMGQLDGKRILGRKTVEKMTSSVLAHTPDYCWGAQEPDRKYGIGFDRREGPGFLYSKGTYMHEGAGSCSLVIDPAEQLAAAWFVPFRPGEWYADGLWNVSNIIWSGLI